MRIIFSYIVLFFTVFTASGQDTLIGYAPAFVGKEVVLKTYQDYLTFNTVELGRGVVDATDSLFRIPFTTKATVKATLTIDKNEGDLYLAPNTTYQVYFPPSEDPISYKNAKTNVYFFGLDTTDINYRILAYHQWFDTYIAYNERLVAKGGFLQCLDSFKLNVARVYKEVKDPFFITYVRYDIAEMEHSAGGNRKSEARLNTYLNYIEPFPVYYENDRYMKFILGFYDKSFSDYLPDTEAAINMALFHSSPTRLMHALRSDLFLANPDLRELIMIDKLGKAFYNELDFRSNIITILDSVANNPVLPFNGIVAKNVKNYITSLEQGYPAPALQLSTEEGESVSWANYKGRFVYVNFFATWNDKSMQEMQVIKDLSDKYGEDIAFISLCTDKSKTTYDAYCEEHPSYKWDTFYIGENSELIQLFKVADVPSYYLIDQEGFIAMAPALGPSPSGEYKSIEDTFFYINKRLHPVDKPRVGGK